MTDEKDRLCKRIKVHNHYTLGAAFLLYQIGKFESRDAICAKIASQYLMNPRFKINSLQLSTIKDRILKYCDIIYQHGGIPEELLEKARECTYNEVSTKSSSGRKTAFLVDTKPPIIGIKFDYSPEIIEEIRKLDSPKFDNAAKVWRISASVSNVENLLKLGFTISNELEEWYHTYCYKFYKEPDINFRIRNLKCELLDFQKQGVAYVLSRNNRALIGDEMGLGKTVQSIAWAQAVAYCRPALIICPASLKYNWAKEIKTWVNNPTIYVINGKPDSTDNYKQLYDEQYLYLKGSDTNVYIIINYDILMNDLVKYTDEEGKERKKEVRYTGWVDFIKKAKIQLVILDEVQYIKNKSSGRAKATISICKDLDNIVALSGTPIENRPIEFFNILNLLNPYQFKNKLEFAEKYCGAMHNGFGWDFNGATNLKELNELVTNSLMIRRLKDEVLTQLPPKRRIIVDIDVENKKEYNKAKADVIGWLRTIGKVDSATKAEKAKALVKINVLKQLALQGKIKNCIEWIRNYLESGNKLVVFVTHTKTIEILLKEFGHVINDKNGIAVEVDGSVDPKTRQKYVEIFQNDDRCRLFIGNIQAAGVGLTLTKAPDTCHIELAMVPALHLQAEDRVHRIGQTADSVNAYYLIARGTIEEEIAKILASKYEILKMTLDGIDVSNIEQQEQGMLSEIVEQILI